MRRSMLAKPMKQTLLAVSASSLMLGATHAGTIGLNVESFYYSYPVAHYGAWSPGQTPAPDGQGYGYQTSGFAVTATAFGVAPANWVNVGVSGTNPALYFFTGSSVSSGPVPLGAATATLTAVNPWESDIGNLTPAGVGEFTVAAAVNPGNDQVTWSILDNTGWTNTLAGLNTAFPSGCVMAIIACGGETGPKVTATSQIVFQAGTDAPFTNNFNNIYAAGNATFPGQVGIMVTPTLTQDTLTFGNVGRSVSSTQSCSMAGFILTDEPVIVVDPASTTVNQGSSLTLNATVIGLGPLAYQWQLAGTNVPGATTLPYSKTATIGDAGNWTLIASNAYGSATSGPGAVTVNQVPTIISDLTPGTNLVFTGTSVSLSVVAGGAIPLSYQWYKNSSPIPGATNASYTANNTSVGLVGYNVIVSNQYSPPVATSTTTYLNVVATPDKYSAAAAASGPNTFLPLNETTGSTAFDYSGFGHNGAISNGVTQGVAGPQPPAFPGFSANTTAYQFDGASSFVACGTNASLTGTTDFSLEAWVNTTSATSQDVIEQRDASGFNGEYELTVGATGDVNFYVYNNGYQGPVTSSASVADGNWHHVVAVRSGGNLFLYVDGALSASSSGAAALGLTPTLQTSIGANIRDNNNYFAGSIADVAIYNYALNTSQVITHYIAATGAPFLVSIKPGGVIQDSKPVGTPHPGFGHNVGWAASVTDANSPPVTRTTVGEFSYASNSQIVTPADPDFNSSTGTIMCWLMATVVPLPGPGSEGAMIFDRRTVGTNTTGAVIVLNNGGGIEVQAADGALVDTGALDFTNGYVADGNWHHVVFTYDQSAAGTNNLYIDGALVTSLGNVTNWSWPAAQELEIGKSHDSYWQLFTGNMDDFRIYSRVLSASEVQSVYSSDALVDTSTLKVRYNFDTAAGIGESVYWSFGTLYTSPTLGPSAVWTPLTGVQSPYSFVPSGSALFFRASY